MLSHEEFVYIRDMSALREYERVLPELLPRLKRLNAYVGRLIAYRKELEKRRLEKSLKHRHWYEKAGANIVEAGWRRAAISGRVNGILQDIPSRLKDLRWVDKQAADEMAARLSQYVNVEREEQSA